MVGFSGRVSEESVGSLGGAAPLSSPEAIFVMRRNEVACEHFFFCLKVDYQEDKVPITHYGLQQNLVRLEMMEGL